MDSYTLPKKGVFKVDITSEQVRYYELVRGEEGYDWGEIDPKEPSAAPLVKTMNLLSGLHFPQYVRDRLEKGELPSYLEILGVTDKESLDGKEMPDTYGMTLVFPKDEGKLSLLATRSQDISYIKTRVKYLSLGADPLKKDKHYGTTKGIAEQLYGGYGDILLKIFDVERGLLIFDFFLPSEDKNHIYVFDPEARKRQEFERERGRRYKHPLWELLRER